MRKAQSNARALLAQSDRLAPEDVNLGERSRQTWWTVTGEKRGALMDLIVRTPFYWIVARLRSNKSYRSDPLEQLDRLVITLANRGWPEARLRLLEAHVGETITMSFAGTARRCTLAVDIEEQHQEGIENDFATKRLATLASGRLPDPDDMDAEALSLRLEASLSVEKARGIEADARAIRAGRKPRVLSIGNQERP